MKKLIVPILILFASCGKEVITKSTHTVQFVRDGQKWQYFHNGIVQDTNSFIAVSGDSVRLYSAESLPQTHNAAIYVDNISVSSHSGFQDTCNLFYIIP